MYKDINGMNSNVERKLDELFFNTINNCNNNLIEQN